MEVLSRKLLGTLEQGMGIWEDKLKYKRYENQLILIKKIHKKKIELGLDESQLESIAMKHGIPLLEAASLEDNNELQELWANLTINAMNKCSNFTLEKVYINVLEQLTPLEAQVLIRIYAINKYEGSILYNIQTVNLPTMTVHTIANVENALLESYNFGLRARGESSAKEPPPPEPSTEIKLALSNLSRLQCIKLAVTFGQVNTALE